MQSGVRTAKAFSRTLINNFQNSLPRFEAEIENIVQQNMNNLHQQISDEEYAATVSSSFNELAETGSQSFEGEEKKLARGITIRIFKDYLSNPRILSSSQVLDEASGVQMEEESKKMNDQDQARLKASIAVSVHQKSNESIEMEQEADESCVSFCVLSDNFKRLWTKVECVLKKKFVGIGLLIGVPMLLGAGIGMQTGGIAAGAVGGGLIGLAITVICSLAGKFWFSSPSGS